MFSVIIPVYNKSLYIEKCIHSVFNQTYMDYEVIIVNDGSTDDSLRKIGEVIEHSSLKTKDDIPERSLKSPHILSFIYHKNSNHNISVTLINQNNSGVSTSRNNGVIKAYHEYIAFLDADDWWEPSYLEEMNDLIREFPDAGLYSSGYYLVRNGKSNQAYTGLEPGFTKGLINYFRLYARTLCMPVWTGSTIIPKNVFENEGGFKRNLKLGEDFDLWIRIAFHSQVILLNKPLAFYNQDVLLTERAVNDKLLEPQEHMIFSDYSQQRTNPDFNILYEKLALYDLLPYYLTEKNQEEVIRILSTIHWDDNELKYRLYYQIIPKKLVNLYWQLRRIFSQTKRRILNN